MRIITGFLVSLLLMGNLNAQTYKGTEASKRVAGASFLRLDEHSGTIKYLKFENAPLYSEEEAIQFFKYAQKLGPEYSYQEIRHDSDQLGMVHIRFQQYYQSYPVLGGVIILHYQNSRLQSINGEVYKPLTAVTHIARDEESCLKIAMDSMGQGTYMWEVPEEEDAIKMIKGSQDATWFPKGELMWVPRDLEFGPVPLYLCYKFNLHRQSPRTAENIYIDASSGELIARENMLHTTDVNGTAITKYSGQKTIITDSVAPFNYRLRENTRGNGVYTLNMQKGTNYGAAVDFRDSNNYWNNFNVNEDEVATDCHWGAETTYDYYKLKFNRNSFNNNNARIVSYVHYSNNYDNAFWDGVRMTYGDGNTYNPLTSIDVCGHEITHAVTTNSANLIYRNESGQLNESFSDIFGNAIERYGKPNGYSWKIGEEITVTGNGLRNMADPRLRNHARNYQGTFWYTGTADNGGVHWNSGVQNWWFYLITEGGAGSNDFAEVYSVDSLGIDKAEQIAYRNLTVYLTPSSNYADSRFYSIQSAVDLFGECSKEVIAVTNAWYACHVGPEYDSGFVKADFIADTVVCSSSQSVNFSNLSQNAGTALWYFGDGDTSTTYNPTHVYGSYGQFTVKLVATSCFHNISDSLTKTAYVVIDSTFDICDAVWMTAGEVDSVSKCESFVYDDGKEDIYAQNKKSIMIISVPGSDSIRINFLDLDYELNYDSLYVYQGYYPGGTIIGAYTGSTIPAGGASILVDGSVVTLRQISDPYVVGRGFKLKYKAIRPTLGLVAFSDTGICKGTSADIRAVASGGYAPDYHFKWSNNIYTANQTVSPTTTTQYKVTLTDVCTKLQAEDSILVDILQPLSISTRQDTMVCEGNSVTLSPTLSGGDVNNYQIQWDQGLGTGLSKLLSPKVTTTYRMIADDNCSEYDDTAYYTIRVKDSLKIQLSATDTVICFNNMVQINATVSGGDTMTHNIFWSHGGGNMPFQNLVFSNSTMVKVTLSDACSVTPGEDSLLIRVRAPLTVDAGRDTLICYGTQARIESFVSGGDTVNYAYSWSGGLPNTSQVNAKPKQTTMYYLTISDNCSQDAVDSVLISVMDKITVEDLVDTLICNGHGVDLKAIASGGLGIYTYQWNFGLSDTTDHNVSPSAPSIYRVIVRDGCTIPGDTAFANIDVKPKLIAEILEADTLICYNKQARFRMRALGGVDTSYSYQWSNGMGTSTVDSLTLTNSSWISVTVTDNCTIDPGKDSVFVVVREPLQVSLPSDTTICYGTSADLKAVVSGGDTSAIQFIWNFGLSDDSLHTVKPLTTSEYIVRVSDNCSDDFSDSMTINVLNRLNIAGLRDTTICYGANLPLQPVFTGGKTLDYIIEWNQGLPALNNHNVSPTTDTEYKVSLNDNCSVPGDTVSIMVKVREPLSVDISLSKDEMCEGDSSVLSILKSGGQQGTLQWTLNNIPLTDTFSLRKPLLTERLIVDLFDNCSEPVADTIDLVVHPLPVLDFSIQYDTVCRTYPVQFNNLSTGALGYQWYFGTGDSSAQPSPEYRYLEAGTYDIVLKAVSDEGCENELSRPGLINVINLPIASYRFNPTEPDYLNRGVQFQQNSSNFVSHKWDFGDGNIENIEIDPFHIYADTGYYYSSLIVYNELGCADTAEALVRVKDVFLVYVPNVISVNEDNVNEFLVVRGRGIMEYTCEIYNRWGERVYRGDQFSKPFDGRDANGEMLMKGSYLLVLTVRDFETKLHYVRQPLDIL